MEILINAHGAGFAQGSTGYPVMGGQQAHSCQGGVRGHLVGPIVPQPCLPSASLPGEACGPPHAHLYAGWHTMLSPEEQDGVAGKQEPRPARMP